MSFNQALLTVMGFGALLGGADHLLGNRFGLGQRFEEAFQLLGPLALSMSGIICLAPLISAGLSGVVVPLFQALGLDPGMFGGILPIDMGGYQLSMDLAADPAVGRFSGIIVSATFGCCLVFTIPVGLGMMRPEDRPWFTRGILLGLLSLPFCLVLGGLACGLPILTTLYNVLPIVICCGLLLLGMRRWRDRIVGAFQCLSRWIQEIAIFGLTLGAFLHLTGWALPWELTSLTDAMEVACSIAIVMLGSMPLAELLQKVMKVPFAWIRRRTGLNAASTTGLLVGAVSTVPGLAMFSRMDPRGQVVNAAFLVCGASTFAAHMGFAVTVEPEMVPSLLLAKLSGGTIGFLIALAATRNMKNAPESVT